MLPAEWLLAQDYYEGLLGYDSQKKRESRGQLEKDSQNRTVRKGKARTRQPEQGKHRTDRADCDYRTVRTVSTAGTGRSE